MNRDELVALAGDAGWTVAGHRRLRMTRGDTRIEIWFVGETPRMVCATQHAPSGDSRRLDVAHDGAAALAAAVMSWIDTPAATESRAYGRVAGNVAEFA